MGFKISISLLVVYSGTLPAMESDIKTIDNEPLLYAVDLSHACIQHPGNLLVLRTFLLVFTLIARQ